MKRIGFAPHLYFLPPVIVLALAAVISAPYSSAVFEPPLLLPLLNTVFLSVLSFIISALAARGWVREGSLPFLLLGCGMASFGVGSLVAGWGISFYGPNFAVTVHNVGSLLGGLCQLGAVVLLAGGMPARPRSTRRPAILVLAAGYSLCVLVVLAVSALAAKGAFPSFFEPDRGPTAIRQAVLGGAILSFALGATVMVNLHARSRAPLFRHYATGLGLTAIGLGLVLREQSVGGIESWTGRAAQYAGSLYFMAAVLKGAHSGSGRGVSLPAYLQEVLSHHAEDKVRSKTPELSELNRKLGHEASEREHAEQEHHELEDNYQAILDHSLQGVAVIRDGKIAYCNEALCRMNGYSRQEIYQMTLQQVLETVHPDDRPEVAAALQAIELEGKEPPATVIRLRRKSGAVRWVEVLAARTIYRRGPALQISCIDITELRQAEAAYRTLVENAPYGMAIFQEGRITIANQALAELVGYSTQELSQMTYDDLFKAVYPDDRQEMLSHISEAPVAGESALTREFRFVRRNGELRWAETTSLRIDFGVPSAQMSFKDVTEKKAAEESLRASRLKMRNLAAHLLRVREKERQRIAQEIHDELGQSLAALKMDLHWLQKHLSVDHLTPVRERLRDMIDLGESAIGAAQRIASDLRPRMLDDLGLAPSLQQLGADFSRRTKIACHVTTDFDPLLIGGNAATAVYRLTQEALANVGRHSKARHVEVCLATSAGEVTLEVRDDGVGITREQAEAPDSYGLVGMRERAEGLGGSLSVSGVYRAGTTVTVRIPLPREGGLA